MKARFIFLAIAVSLLASGSYYGLWVAPPDAMMGDVQRIMYVHVPCAWMAFVAFLGCFLVSAAWLIMRRYWIDALAESFAEVGVLFNVLLLGTGMIWGRPTWGVYWTWDPRLTTAAIMCFMFAAYLGLRQFNDDPEKRATFAAIYAVFASVNLPLVWFSVRWWRTLHQMQSSPETVSHSMVIPLRINAFAMLSFLIFFVWQRYLIAEARIRVQLAPEGVA